MQWSVSVERELEGGQYRLYSAGREPHSDFREQGAYHVNLLGFPPPYILFILNWDFAVASYILASCQCAPEHQAH